MKNFFIKTFTKLVKPLYGTGIWNYTPFRQLYKFYQGMLAKNSSLYNTKYGFKMQLDGSKFIDKEIMFHGLWEKNISEILCKELKLGNTFLDIGANIWYFSLLWSQAVWLHWKVIAFEPSLLNYTKLVQNIEINSYSNIKIHKLWVWSHEEFLDIYYNDTNPGASSLIKIDSTLAKSPPENIKVVWLDLFLWEISVDFIKMDIEWFEFEAILWMENILKNSNTKLIFEYSPRLYKKKEENYEEYSISLLNKLNSFGFSLYHIWQSGDLEKINNNADYYKMVMNNTIWQSDILCKKE